MFGHHGRHMLVNLLPRIFFCLTYFHRLVLDRDSLVLLSILDAKDDLTNGSFEMGL